ncbi:MAG TPA: DsbA family protein [Actinomycetota bacterium]|nr:DsbA family protein [Actinomycetota bacterium]
MSEPARRVRLYYDLVCPYSYLEGVAAEAAEDAGKLAIEWLPFELRPAPAPLLEPRGEHLRTDWPRRVYRLALERGVEIHLPRHQPRSTLPLAACLWATERGALRPFRRALYEAMFCEGTDISSDHEIARAARRAGLAPEGAIEAAYSPDYIRRLHTIRAEAQRAGVRGVPSAVTEDGRVHWGAGPITTLAEDDRVLVQA